MGVSRNVGPSVKWLVLRMGGGQNVGLSVKWLVLRMGHFRMDLMVTKGDES